MSLQFNIAFIYGCDQNINIYKIYNLFIIKITGCYCERSKTILHFWVTVDYKYVLAKYNKIQEIKQNKNKQV